MSRYQADADDRAIKKAGRWATASSIFGLLTTITTGAFADTMRVQFGIPAMAVYVMAGAGAVIVLAESLLLVQLPKAVFTVLTIIFDLIALALVGMLCVAGYRDDSSQMGLYIVIGMFVLLFVVPAATTLRATILKGRI